MQMIRVGVFRRLDNRREGLPDNSPRASQLHQRRARALHRILEEEPNLVVKKWGATDDKTPHEFIEVTVTVVAGAVFRYAVVPALKWLGEKLAEKAVDLAVTEGAKALVSRLRRAQTTKQIENVVVTLPNQTTISLVAPTNGSALHISFKDGKNYSFKYVNPPSKSNA